MEIYVSNFSLLKLANFFFEKYDLNKVCEMQNVNDKNCFVYCLNAVIA